MARVICKYSSKLKKYVYLVIGLFLGIVFTFLLIKYFQQVKVSEHSHEISYKINRMNKMIVAEQAISEVYSHKSSKSLPFFDDYFSFDKRVLLLVNAKVQATYDLNKLDLTIDSLNNKIIIKSIPELDLQVYPDVQIYDLEQSSFNKFEKDELNEVRKKAVKAIEDKIDREQLECEAKEQLLKNLLDLYILAAAYDWQVEDRTEYAEELEEMFR